MKYTLLEITQDILSNLNSDEVNSINDNAESLQVARIVRQKYFDIINRLDLPDHDQLIQLNPSTDQTLPVLMYVPDGVSGIKWIKYFNSNANPGIAFTASSAINNAINGVPPSNGWVTYSSTSITVGTGTKTFTVPTGLTIKTNDPVVITETSNAFNTMSGTVTSYSGTTLVVNITSSKGSGTHTDWTLNGGILATLNTPPGYAYVTILPNVQFIDFVNAFNPTDQDVFQYTFSDTSNNFDGNFNLYYKNDAQPTYCTVISNKYVLFDSYDSTQDSTLQKNKIMASGGVIPVFLLEDTFIPDLAEEEFTLLLNESKALAFYELKQQDHPLANREVQRGWSSIQKKKAVVNKPTYFQQTPDFGRRGSYLWSTAGLRGDIGWNWKWR
jgi:hypothetical protein